AGVDAAGGAEAEAFAVALEQFELGDLELAVPDAFHAPQAGMVVQRRALARTPGHRHHAVAVFGAAVELAPGVVVDDGLVHALGQAHVAVLDQPAQRIADGGRDRVLVAAGDGRVDGPDQLVAAGEVDAGAAGIGHGADSSRSRKPRTAGPKRSKSTRKASWPWGDSSGRKAASAPPARRPSATCSCC